MEKQIVYWQNVDKKLKYQQVWELQEQLLQASITTKKDFYSLDPFQRPTQHHLLLVEHDPVFTLGKSGQIDHLLVPEAELQAMEIEYFKINRGGDITFHGPGQLVGYPILDLEKFQTDIGKYLRNLEEVIIKVLAQFGLKGQRSVGETGVWLEPDVPGKERKICAMGVRCSRWVTMHGWALNVNTDLNYFSYIVPCGISNKKVTSLQKEMGVEIDFNLVKNLTLSAFSEVFEVQLIAS